MLVLVTAAVGTWRASLTLRVCTGALVASWGASLLLAGDLRPADLAETYGLIHTGVLLLACTMLVLDGALWLVAMALIAALQFAVHIRVMLDVDAPEQQLSRGFSLAIALLFTGQLACIWWARTPSGRWWPTQWRHVAPRLEEVPD